MGGFSGEAVHEIGQGHQLLSVRAPVAVEMEGGERGEAGDLLNGAGLGLGDQAVHRGDRRQDQTGDGGGEQFKDQGRQKGQTGHIEEQMLLPVGLYQHKGQKADDHLDKAETNQGAGLRLCKQQEKAGKTQCRKEDQAKVPEYQQEVGVDAQSIGGVEVAVIGAQDLLQKERVHKTYGANGAGEEQSRKIPPVLPGEEKFDHKRGNAEGEGKKEKVAPKGKGPHQKEPGD